MNQKYFKNILKQLLILFALAPEDLTAQSSSLKYNKSNGYSVLLRLDFPWSGLDYML